MVKVGQFAAAYPKMLPDQFVEALGSLSFQAPPMHYALIREVLLEQFGAAPESVFKEFEPKAFAAASLGQVHRATLDSGERVAVKIQYPNIARTIQADYRNLMAIMAPMRLTKDWDNIRAQWEEIRRMMEWETDYLREARFQERARAVFTPADRVVVPRVYERFTTQRVLTMEYLDGWHIDGYLAQHPDQEARDEAGRLVALASLRIAHAAKFWYGDANHGNFVFMKDGRLGVLDFGCSREFTEDEWAYYVAVGHAHLGERSWHDIIPLMADLDPSEPVDPEYESILTEMAMWWGDYVTFDGAYDFADEAMIERGLALMRKIAERRYFRSLPINTWLTRHLLGLRGLLFRLKARVPMRALILAESRGVLVD
jgi:predicted unusual protein kinase regulating ubiquinone biosynthesis (AarF/ABC1/UbiB family)